jgi:hypothetical protein
MIILPMFYGINGWLDPRVESPSGVESTATTITPYHDETELLLSGAYPQWVRNVTNKTGFVFDVAPALSKDTFPMDVLSGAMTAVSALTTMACLYQLKSFDQATRAITISAYDKYQPGRMMTLIELVMSIPMPEEARRLAIYLGTPLWSGRVLDPLLVTPMVDSDLGFNGYAAKFADQFDPDTQAVTAASIKDINPTDSGIVGYWDNVYQMTRNLARSLRDLPGSKFTDGAAATAKTKADMTEFTRFLESTSFWTGTSGYTLDSFTPGYRINEYEYDWMLRRGPLPLLDDNTFRVYPTPPKIDATTDADEHLVRFSGIGPGPSMEAAMGWLKPVDYIQDDAGAKDPLLSIGFRDFWGRNGTASATGAYSRYVIYGILNRFGTYTAEKLVADDATEADRKRTLLSPFREHQYIARTVFDEAADADDLLIGQGIDHFVEIPLHEIARLQHIYLSKLVGLPSLVS